jgi:phage tail sheath protein FI
VNAIGEGTWGNRLFVRIKDSSLKKNRPNAAGNSSVFTLVDAKGKTVDANGNPVSASSAIWVSFDADGNLIVVDASGNILPGKPKLPTSAKDPANNPLTPKPVKDPIGFRLTVLYFLSDPPLDSSTNNLAVDPTDPDTVTYPARRNPAVVEDYDNLTVDPQNPNYAPTVVNGASQIIQINDPGGAVQPDTTSKDFKPLKGGTDGSAASDNNYIGWDAQGNLPASIDKYTGLAGLEVIEEISLLSVPDANDVDRFNVTTEMMTQCERLKNRFAVLQFKNGKGDVTTLSPPEDTSYSAIYYPWIRVFNPVTQDYPLIPPCGHVLGIYANTDITVGVHKAPANYEIAGIVTRDLDSTRKPLEFIFTKGQQDILNPIGINVIRDFRLHQRGIRVWGARTMSTDTQWKYINVRRLFIFVEQSIDRGTQWVVFEPNDETTWARVRRSIENFLITVWRSGALMGTTQDEAFFVKCDLTTMTQDDIDNGRLICYIGIAPVKPAEFVIFRISQKTIEATQ